MGGATMAYILQYMGVNYALFGGLSKTVSYPLGRLLECIPFLSIGTLLSYYDIPQKICNLTVRTLKNMIIVLILVLLCIKMKILNTPMGFGYSGIGLGIFSTILFLIFFNMHSIISCNFIVRKWIGILSGYTLGVYCMHVFIGKVLTDFTIQMNFGIDGSISFCIAIFIMSILVSIGLGKISKLKELVC